MTRSPRAGSPTAPDRRIRNPRLWIWGTIGIAVLLCALTASLHFLERRAIDEATARVGDLREARVDLAKGFLYASLAGDPRVPYSREEGLALVQQALASFELALAAPEVAAVESAPALGLGIAGFRERLAEWSATTPPDPERSVALRIAYGELERQADRVNVQLERASRESASMLDLAFRLALGAMGLVLAAGCAVAIWLDRGRGRTETALRESEERLRLALAAADHGLYDIDVQTGEVIINPEYARMLGYDPTDFREGATWTERMHPDDRESLVAVYRDYIAGKLPGFRSEFRLRTLTGEWKWMLCLGEVMERDAAGAPLRMLGTLTDITALREAQERARAAADETARLLEEATASRRALLSMVEDQRAAEAKVRRLNQELEQRVRARTADLEGAIAELETFSYSVSHDLRAPLRAMSGFPEILARKYGDRLDEEGRHYLDNIVRASQRMGALIEDLLLYSRVGRDAVREEPVPLALIAERLAATFGERIAAAGARFEVVEPLATPVGDPTLVEQILANLVGNALTYGRPDVTLRVTLSATLQGGHVVIGVADNGIGIEPEYRESIFEVFRRLHTDEEHPGTGIGLAIVRKAARLMGTEVSLDSTPGVGSTFSLGLPAAPGQAEAP